MNKSKSRKPELGKLTRYDNYPDWHEPLCKYEKHCYGCDERRSRINRNRRAAREIGIGSYTREHDEPAKTCGQCATPAYLGTAGEQALRIIGWNYDSNRAEWAIEEAPREQVKALCPRCRKKAAA